MKTRASRTQVVSICFAGIAHGDGEAALAEYQNVVRHVSDRHDRRHAERHSDIPQERLLHRHGQCQRSRYLRLAFAKPSSSLLSVTALACAFTPQLSLHMAME